jgi:hypothetical protein
MALTVGWVLFGFATSASAGDDYSPPPATASTGDCAGCKPTTEVHHEYIPVPHDVTIVKHQKVTKHVPVRHTIITVKRYQPIRRIHLVTQVDIYKVPKPYLVKEVRHEHLPEISKVVSHRFVYVNHGCGCQEHGSY